MDPLERIVTSTLKISPEELNAESRVGETPGWDSLSHMNLILAIESDFSVEFTGDEIAEMQSVRQIRETLERRGVSL